MENASKALMMAAGVLIGLLILSLAVFLFTNFGAASAEAHRQNEENQINQFNAQFTVYEGTGKKSANLSSMINKVTMSNGGSENKVLIEFDGKLYEEAEINNIVDLLSATDTYEVKCEYDSATNLVNKIVVTKVVEEE